MACGVLVPQPGIKPVYPALEGEVLTTGSPVKCPRFFSTNGRFHHLLDIKDSLLISVYKFWEGRVKREGISPFLAEFLLTFCWTLKEEQK